MATYSSIHHSNKKTGCLLYLLANTVSSSCGGGGLGGAIKHLKRVFLLRFGLKSV